MKNKLENTFLYRLLDQVKGVGLRVTEVKAVWCYFLLTVLSLQIHAQCNASFSFSGATCASNECFDITVAPTFGTGFYLFHYEGDAFDPTTDGVITDQGNGILEFCPQDAQNSQLGDYTISYSVPSSDPACATSFFVQSTVEVQAAFDPCFTIVDNESFCAGSDLSITANEDWTSLPADLNAWTLDDVPVTVLGTHPTYTFTVPSVAGTYNLMHRTNDDLCAEFCSATVDVIDCDLPPPTEPATSCTFAFGEVAGRCQSPGVIGSPWDLFLTIIGPPSATYEVNISGDVSVYSAEANGEMTQVLLGYQDEELLWIIVSMIGGNCPAISTTATHSCQPPTAVELIRFEGEVLTEGNLLTWTTGTEVDNEHFTLERSATGTGEWKAVGNITGGGTSNASIDYAHLDEVAPNGTSFYRLKDTNYSGTTRVASDVVSLARNLDGFAIKNVFPVPTKEMLFLEFQSDKNGSATGKLIDVTGKEVSVLAINMNVGINQMQIDLSRYPAGTYLLTITNSEKTINAKVIKD